MSSSGSSSPFSICSLAMRPSSVSAWISARKMLPETKEGTEAAKRAGSQMQASCWLKGGKKEGRYTRMDVCMCTCGEVDHAVLPCE
jgi:hypothetical protein